MPYPHPPLNPSNELVVQADAVRHAAWRRSTYSTACTLPRLVSHSGCGKPCAAAVPCPDPARPPSNVLHPGRTFVDLYATTALPVLLPAVEEGVFNDNWRIRQSSVELLGELLFKVRYLSADC